MASNNRALRAELLAQFLFQSGLRHKLAQRMNVQQWSMVANMGRLNEPDPQTCVLALERLLGKENAQHEAFNRRLLALEARTRPAEEEAAAQ